MEKIAIDDALHQGRELGFREGLERGKILGWAELMTRRYGLDDRESRQSITRPSSATSNSARRRSTPRWVAIMALYNITSIDKERQVHNRKTLIPYQFDPPAEGRALAHPYSNRNQCCREILKCILLLYPVRMIPHLRLIVCIKYLLTATFQL